MTSFRTDVDGRRAIERIDAITPRVREALLGTVAEIKDDLIAEVRARAPVKSGAFKASITGVVYGSKTAVRGVIRAGSREAWYAHILEYGARLPERDIVAESGAMKFGEGGEDFYRRKVHFPGAELAERDIVTGPLKARRARIEATIKKTVKDAVSSK